MNPTPPHASRPASVAASPLTAWSLRTWPPLWCQADQANRVPLKHLGTHIVSANEAEGLVSGQTLWGNAADVGPAGPAGVAWDWIVVSDGVVAMADPMSLVTNVRLLDDGGEVLTAWQSARYLNEMVHALPWQHEVELALRAEPN